MKNLQAQYGFFSSGFAFPLLLLSGCGSPEFIVSVEEWPAGAARIRILTSIDGRRGEDQVIKEGEQRFSIKLPADAQGQAQIVLLALDSADATTACNLAKATVIDTIPTGLRRYVEHSVKLAPLPIKTCSLKVKIDAGGGLITSSPSGLQCSGQAQTLCESEFTKNSSVNLSAQNDGRSFPNPTWTGATACPAGESCTVQLDQSKQINITFGQRQCSQDGWCVYNASPVSPLLHPLAVWGSGRDDVWVAATTFMGTLSSDVYRWNGKSWTSLRPSAADRYRDIFGTGPNDVWVSTDGGSILRWDGSWTVMKGATSAWLYGIWGTDRSNIWAVGFGYMQSFKGVAYQKTGTSSETLKFNRDAALQKIWGTSANDIWMVGDAFENKLGLAHWNGASINTV